MKYFISVLLIPCFQIACAQQQLIKVNTINNAPEEVSIAINPLNTKEVAASSNIDNYYFSLDGGKTWKEKRIKSKNGIWGDPVVHYDNLGNLYYAHLGKNSDKAFPKWIDRMVVQRININYDSCFADRSIGSNAGKIQDKEWISSDANGNLFFSWTEFDNYSSKKPSDHSRIKFATSNDRGNSWSAPLVISDFEGDCQDGDSTMEGATSCSNSKGTIFVAWSGLNKIWFDKSTNAGKSFGTDKIIAEHVEGWDMPVKNIYRANGMPFMACDASGSKYKDRIYVNWCDTRNGDPDVFIKYSDDEGATWSNDIRVNTDLKGNGAEQFSNNIAVDASTGYVYIVFYDKRNSSSAAFIDVYVARSRDGGTTWDNFRITQSPFPAPGKTTFFGDYIDIDAVNGKVMPVFTSNNKGTFTVYAVTLDTLADKNFKEPNNLQAVVLNDSLFIHLILPEHKKYKLTISYNGIKKEISAESDNGELDVTLNARGFSEALVTLQVGRKKKSVTVFN